MIVSETLKLLLIQSVDAFNCVDVKRLAGFYHNDAINHQEANESVFDKSTIERMFVQEFSQSKIVCVVEQVLSDDNLAILE